jgi:putative ABC transport system permease protein
VKYLHIILANLGRKKFRTVLTVGSFTVALFLFGLLVVIDIALNQGADVAGADRLIVLNRVSMIQPLPIAYQERIRGISGVEEVTHFVWFGGVYQDQRNFFPNFAVDVETARDVYPEYKLPDEHWNAFVADRQGCIVGRDIAKRFGWKVGDRIPLEGTIWRGTWEFNIHGIYDLEGVNVQSNELWFQYDYLEEQRPFFKGTVGWYGVSIARGADAVRISKEIDDRFANSPWETKTETEKAFMAGFAKQIGNIRLLLVSVGSVVFITLLLVTGNTMAMSVRERTGELAVMKTVGFTDHGTLGLVMAESTMLAAAGGAIGLVLVKLFTLRGDPTGGMLGIFYLPNSQMLVGFVFAVGLGLVAGLVPGLNAMRLRIVDALRRV